MIVNAVPPCQAACPIQMDVQGYVAAIFCGFSQGHKPGRASSQLVS